MDWQRELAKRCEIELEEIERLCRKCEDIEEWRTPHDARDDWRDGPRHVFALVIIFPNEFSLLRCLERESRKIDNLLTEIDDTGGSATKLPNSPTDDAAVNDTYDLSYFRQDHYRWSVRFKAWRNNLSATETSPGATEKERLVAAVTGDFALLYYLQEALRESSELWHEWGPASFDIIDGIKARIEALLYLKEQAPNPGDVIHPSIKSQWNMSRTLDNTENIAIQNYWKKYVRRDPSRVKNMRLYAVEDGSTQARLRIAKSKSYTPKKPKRTTLLVPTLKVISSRLEQYFSNSTRRSVAFARQPQRSNGSRKPR